MTTQSNRPLIVGFVADLYFSVRLANVAERLNYHVEWIESAAQLGAGQPDTRPNQPGEPVFGPAGALMDRLTQWQPALLIFDLGNQAVPWRHWIAIIKSSPATRRLPILCFGSHVDVEATRLAKAAGANAVVARSRFVTALPELIQKYARLPDREAFVSACQEPLSPLAIKGLELFNHGDYFEAHEVLEEAWNEDSSAGRALYQAILQVGVAYLQIERGNYNGAVKMLLRARQWLEPLPEMCRGVDVTQLRADATAVYDALVQLGPSRLEHFDRAQFRPLPYSQ